MESIFLKAMENYDSNIDIKHYGVKGMKWGVRTQFYTDPQTNLNKMRHEFSMAKDPKKANKKAVELSRKALEAFGETDPQKILNEDFSTFMNRTFMAIVKETPKDQVNEKTAVDAYKKAMNVCASVYMAAKITEEANKRLAEKVTRRSAIESASPDVVKKRSQSIRKRALVLGGIGAVLTAIGAANIVGDYKRRNSPDSVLTKEGAALKNFIKGGKR